MIALCGPGESGKDLAAHWLKAHTSLRYQQSTSEAAAEIVFERWGHKHYPSVEACHVQRRLHRQEWQDIILAYNAEDPDGIALYKAMQPTDILNGIRTVEDLQGCKKAGLVTLAIWIDRKDKPLGFDPMGLRSSHCDIVIENEGTDRLFERLTALAKALGVWRHA